MLHFGGQSFPDDRFSLGWESVPWLGEQEVFEGPRTYETPRWPVSRKRSHHNSTGRRVFGEFQGLTIQYFEDRSAEAKGQRQKGPTGVSHATRSRSTSAKRWGFGRQNSLQHSTGYGRLEGVVLVFESGGVAGLRIRRAFALPRRQLPHLREILLHVLLIGQRNFVAVDLPACFHVRGVLLRILGLQLLLAGRDFHHHFARDVGGALADNLAEFSHCGQFGGFAGSLVAVLLADAALAVGRVGLIVAASLALALRGLLGPALLLVAFRLRIRAGIGLFLARRFRSRLPAFRLAGRTSSSPIAKSRSAFRRLVWIAASFSRADWTAHRAACLPGWSCRRNCRTGSRLWNPSRPSSHSAGPISNRLPAMHWRSRRSAVKILPFRRSPADCVPAAIARCSWHRLWPSRPAMCWRCSDRVRDRLERGVVGGIQIAGLRFPGIHRSAWIATAVGVSEPFAGPCLGHLRRSPEQTVEVDVNQRRAKIQAAMDSVSQSEHAERNRHQCQIDVGGSRHQERHAALDVGRSRHILGALRCCSTNSGEDARSGCWLK